MPPITYTPSTQVAYGNSDSAGSSAIAEYQSSLNKQNATKSGYVPLVIDGRYGPKTLAASKFGGSSNNLINTSTKSRTTFAQNGADLEAALAKLNGNSTVAEPNQGDTKTTTTNEDQYANDPFMKSLTNLQNTSDVATKALIESTRAAYQNKINTTNTQYEDYKKGLQLLGIQTNEAQSSPLQLAGHIQKAANDQAEKIDALTVEENKAIIDAKTAKDNNDFKILDEKMKYIKQLKDEKAQAIKDMYDSISNSDKAAAYEAHDIYDTMQTLNPNDQESFIQAVSKKYNIPVMSLVTALNDEKASRETANLKTQNTKSIIAKRGTTGGGTGAKPTVQSASTEIDTHIKSDNLLGSDGYMAPEKWIELRDAWVKNKLAAGTFNTLYKRYLNPLSYEKAGFAKPKSSRTL